MNTKKPITRREFLKIAGFLAGTATLAACSPSIATAIAPTASVQPTTGSPTQSTGTSLPTTQSTQVPTQATTAVPTATTASGIVTPQGRTLPADAAPLDKQIFNSSASELKNFDYAANVYECYGMNSLSEPLIHNDQNFVIVPAMADSWKPGPQADYWEFHIRSDAVWSDGTPVTADDVVYTWAHAADPAMANPFIFFYYPIKGVEEVAKGGPSTLITDPKTGGVRKIDDNTVQIYGEGPDPNGDPCPYMLGLLSYQASCIIPEHIASKDPLHWADNLPQISAGPYLCSSWNHNVSMTWDINPTYNGPDKPGIQHINNIITTANTNMMSTFLGQTIDMIQILAASDVATANANSKLKALVHNWPDFETQYVPFNTFMKPLDNAKLRMALAKSIDRATLDSQVLNNTYVPGATMLPPGFPAYNKDLESAQAYDVASAQKLLADAGYPGGKDSSGNQLVLEITSQGGADDLRAPFFQQQWQTNLGIKINIKEVSSGDWGTLRSKHQMQMWFGQYEYDYVDPNDLLTLLWHSDSVTAAANNTPLDQWGAPRFPWYDAQFDQLCDQAGTETDTTKRMQLYDQAETILVNSPAAVFYDHQIISQIWWPWIVGIPANKLGEVAFRWLDITQFQMYVSKDVDTLKAQYKGLA